MKQILLASCACLAFAVTARAAEPIKIGIIAENSAIGGIAIPNGAQIAADEINAKGGIDGRMIELVAYDDHNSAADAVRAFQRLATQDKVAAVIASYTSEVALALEPWSGRLKMPFITPGAASDELGKRIHADYAHLKYSFHGYLASAFLAQSVCDAAKDLLVGQLHMKTAVIFSEDAAWTTPLDAGYEACLPKIGIQVVDHIRVNPDTTDFTPIYNRIEAKKPDVMITGISHVGVQPTVQWATQQVPIPMFGISSQATSSTFWKDTNGQTEGVVLQLVATDSIATTAKTIPFAQAYQKKFGVTPAYTGYMTYDELYIIADAIHRAGGTDPDKMVDALEKTNYTGTVGQMHFFGKDDPFTHALVYGPNDVSGLVVQWHDGKQVPVWPLNLQGVQKMVFPAFVKTSATN
jgi:branched-chain amino acid transport system substrate-binding protein